MDVFSSTSIDNLWDQESIVDSIVEQLDRQSIVTVFGTAWSGRASLLRTVQKRLAKCAICSVSTWLRSSEEEFWSAFELDIAEKLSSLDGVTEGARAPGQALLEGYNWSGAINILVDDLHMLQGQSYEESALVKLGNLPEQKKVHVLFSGDMYPSGADLIEDFAFSDKTEPINLNSRISDRVLEQYVLELEKEHGIAISSDSVNYIFKLTGSEPVLIQKICAALARLYHGKEIGPDDPEVAASDVIKANGNELFGQQFNHLTFVERIVVLIAKALFQDQAFTASQFVEQLANDTRLSEHTATGFDFSPEKPLEALARRGIMRRQGLHKYEFSNLLFNSWLPPINHLDLGNPLTRELVGLGTQMAQGSSHLETWMVSRSFPHQPYEKQQLTTNFSSLLFRGEEVTRPIILHISDTQFGKDHAFKSANPNDVGSLFRAFTTALESFPEHGIPQPNIVVFSGDVASTGRYSEYDQAGLFLTAVKNHLEIDDNRVVLVPGNHDVNFKLSQASYLKLKFDDDEDYEQEDGWPQEEHYPLRFQPFQQFFKGFYHGRRSYSLKPEEMYSIYHYPELDIAIVGLNSCATIDHMSRHKAFIDEQAIMNAKKELDGIGCSRIIVVWHHNPEAIGGYDDYLSNAPRIPEILGKNCLLGLYGHIHQPWRSYRLTSPSGNHGFESIGAGSVSVKEKGRGGGDELKGNAPFSFNVIDLLLERRPYQARLYCMKSQPSGGGSYVSLNWQPHVWSTRLYEEIKLE